MDERATPLEMNDTELTGQPIPIKISVQEPSDGLRAHSSNPGVGSEPKSVAGPVTPKIKTKPETAPRPVKISPEIAAASAELAKEAAEVEVSSPTNVMPLSVETNPSSAPAEHTLSTAGSATPAPTASSNPAAADDRPPLATPTTLLPTGHLDHGPASSSKPIIYALLATLLVLALGGLAAWWASSHKPADKTAKTVVDPRKDIPSITYTLSDEYTNAFPPTFPSQTISSIVDRQVFEALVGFKGQNKLVPLLAKSWTNTDDNTWVFKLQPNVSFHTGRVMEAIDVKTSIEAAQKEAGYAVFTNTIKSVEVVDGLTVKITTKQPDAVLLNRLSFVFIYDSKSEKKNDAINGSGPYILKPGTIVSTKHTEFVAYDNYHGGHVFTRQLVFQTVNYSDAAVIAALKNHTYQLSTNLTDAQADDLAKSVAGSKIETFSTNSVFSLMLNTVKGPLTSLKLRQALLYTIDPQKLIDASGITSVVANQAAVSSVPGYNPSIVRPAIDIAKAKQLVIDAGYPKGVTLNMTTISSQTKYIDPLVKQLAEIGVTVKPTLIEIGKYFDFVEHGGTDISLASYNSDINDFSDIVSALLQSGNVYNIYKNPAIDKLQTEANSIFEPEKRLLKLQEIAKIASEDIPLIPIRERIGKAYFDKDYGYSFDFPANTLLGVNFWQMYQK